MVRVRTASAALALALALIAPATAGADLRWTKPQTIGKGFPNRVLTDARGDSLALWAQATTSADTTNLFSWRAPGGSWTKPQVLSTGSYLVSAHMTPLGHVTAVWNDGPRIVAAESRPGRAFSQPRTVVDIGRRVVSPPALGGDDAGNLVLAYSFDETDHPDAPKMNASSSIGVVTRTAGGDWSEPHAVGRWESGGALSVAVNAAGAAAVTWLKAQGGLARLSYRPPGGSFGGSEAPELPGPGIPQLALDDTGRAVVAMPKGIFSPDEATTVLAARSPLGEWSEPHEFQTPAYPRRMLAAPTGDVSVLLGTRDMRVQHALVRPGGAVDGPSTIATDAFDFDAAMNLRGDMLVTWYSNPETSQSGGRIFVAERRRSGAVFGPAVPLTVEKEGVEPIVSLNDAGQAAGMWALVGGGGWADPSVRLAVREDPELPALPFPPVIDIDLPEIPRLDGDGDLVVDVSCSLDCRAAPNGILIPGGGDELVAAAGSSRRLRAGRRSRLTLDFGAKRAMAVRRALRAGRKPWVSLTVRARGKSPRPMTVSRRVRLRK